MMVDILSALDRCPFLVAGDEVAGLAGSSLKRLLLYSRGILALDNARLVVVVLVGLLAVDSTRLSAAASPEEKKRRRLRKVEVDEEEVLFLGI